MKELETQITVQEAEVREIKKNMQYLGSKRLKRGQKLFRLDLTNGEITEVELKKTATIVNGKLDSGRIRVEMDANSLYEPALNMENARRKFRERVNRILGK